MLTATGQDWLRHYHARKLQPFTMRLLLPITLVACSCALLADLLNPRQKADLPAMEKCMEVHPAEYCRLTYAPSLVADKQR